MTAPKLKVSFGQSSDLAKIVRVEELAWEDFARKLTTQPPAVDDKSSVGWYTAAEFEAEHRHGKTFVARYALTLDYDHIAKENIAQIAGAFEQWAHVMYTTWSHTPEKPRIRVVMPLSRPAGADEFQAVSRWIAARANIEWAAGESHVVAQMMFMPAVKPSMAVTFRAKINEGQPVDVDAVLGEYADWTDHKSWPHRGEGDNVYNADELPTPPDEKAGIVGDFCRTYDVPAAIEKFGLPYVRTENPDRWTYTSGSRPEGAIVYDGGRKLHSHHDTDPARGQHNAFDLVRLHRFAALDAAVEVSVAITDRPSFRQMVGLALEQNEVRRQQVIAELDDVTAADVARHTRDIGGAAREVPRENRFTVLAAADFTGGKPLDWIVKSLLPKAQVGVIYGPPTVGKSFAVLDISAHVSRGIPWRGLKTKKGRVVMVVAEGAGGFKKRMQAHANEFSVPMDLMPDVIADAPDLKDPAHAAQIAAAIGEAALVVIDTLAASFTGNENSGEDIGLVLRHCKFIHEKTGAMVWLVHHSGKDETKGARGWSGLRAAADVEMEVSQRGDVRTLSLTKLKDGDSDKKWGFTLKAVMLGTDEDGDAISSCVVEASEIKEGDDTGRAEPTSRWQQRVLKAARRLARHGSVTKREVAVAVLADGIPDEDKKSQATTERAIRRAIDDLIHAEVWLFKHGDKISLTRAVDAGEEFNDD